jgi:hypothetical protein
MNKERKAEKEIKGKKSIDRKKGVRRRKTKDETEREGKKIFVLLGF